MTAWVTSRSHTRAQNPKRVTNASQHITYRDNSKTHPQCRPAFSAVVLCKLICLKLTVHPLVNFIDFLPMYVYNKEFERVSRLAKISIISYFSLESAYFNPW